MVVDELGGVFCLRSLFGPFGFEYWVWFLARRGGEEVGEIGRSIVDEGYYYRDGQLYKICDSFRGERRNK